MKRIFVIATASAVFMMASASVLAQARPTATPATAAAPKPTATPATAVAPKPTAAPSVNVPNTKMAVVDTTIFADETAGIKRYLRAVKSVEAEFQTRNAEFVNLQNRLKALVEEINKLSSVAVVAPQSIQTKQEEAERLGRDLKYRKEQADADVEKRYKEVVGPVSADIGKALDLFAVQHGLTMILDITKMLPAVITVNPAVDVTQAFVAEYNIKNP